MCKVIENTSCYVLVTINYNWVKYLLSYRNMKILECGENLQRQKRIGIKITGNEKYVYTN